MIPSSITLPNGLRVVALRTDGAPLVTIGIAYHVGATHESPQQTGYAHLFEHLMFDNLDRPDGKSFDELVTDAGGTSNAYTTFDWTYYHMTLPAHAWELGLQLEAERMRGFAISPTALETQRRVVIEEISENVFNQPYGTAQMLLARTAFKPGSCYSWDVYGSIEHLRAMTREDARQWYERYYRPNNAVLSVVGRLESLTAVLERVAELFSTITASSLPVHDVCNAEPQHAYHVERDTTLPADMLICAYHLPGIRDRSTLNTAKVLATLLGTGRSSPVARHFVYDKMLAHTASVGLDIRERASLLEFSAVARTKSTTADMLLHHWQTLLEAFLAEHPLSKEHMERTRNKIRRRFAQSFQTTEGLADMLASATLFYDDPEQPWKNLTELIAIDQNAICELAEKLFTQEPVIVEYSTVP